VVFLFAIDIPCLFLIGLIVALMNRKWSQVRTWVWLALLLVSIFGFQLVGMFLFFDVLGPPLFSGREFMLMPFNLLGITGSIFPTGLAIILFALEPLAVAIGLGAGQRTLSRKEEPQVTTGMPNQH